MIQKYELVVPSIFDRGDGVTEVMVEYIIGNYIIGLYNKVIKVKRPYYRIGI